MTEPLRVSAADFNKLLASSGRDLKKISASDLSPAKQVADRSRFPWLPPGFCTSSPILKKIIGTETGEGCCRATEHDNHVWLQISHQSIHTLPLSVAQARALAAQLLNAAHEVEKKK